MATPRPTPRLAPVTSAVGIPRLSSIPVLYLRPDFAESLPGPAAIEDVEVFVGHGVRVRHGGDLLDHGETGFQIARPSGHDDDALAGVAAGPPQEVALMAADRRRQAI